MAALRAAGYYAEADRVYACAKYGMLGTCGACGHERVKVFTCSLGLLCRKCARREAQRWRAKVFALTGVQRADKYLFVIFSLRPWPNEQPVSVQHRRRVQEAHKAIWRALKRWGARHCIRAYEAGPKNGIGHCNYLVGGPRGFYAPRWTLQVALIRATRRDAPGARLPREIMRLVRIAAHSHEEVDKRNNRRRRSGRKARISWSDVQDARAKVEAWTRERGASWDVHVKPAIRPGQTLEKAAVEVTKYITKFSEVPPDVAVAMYEAWRKVRRIELLGDWRCTVPRRVVCRSCDTVMEREATACGDCGARRTGGCQHCGSRVWKPRFDLSTLDPVYVRRFAGQWWYSERPPPDGGKYVDDA